MNFSDKLIILMNITDTSNKSLADHLHVDPSRISQLRTGRRKLPKRRESVEEIATFFANRCSSPSQRLALAESIGNPSIRYQSSPKVLGTILINWFYEENMETLQLLDALGQEAMPQPHLPRVSEIPQETSTKIYYGNEGKREALLLAYQYIIDLKDSETIYITSDEDTTYYKIDPTFSGKLQEFRSSCVQNGHQIVQIINPSASSFQTFETITQWLPGYMFGAVHPYYYPRIRDGIFRHTMIIVPGKVVFFCESITNQIDVHFSLFSTAPETATAYANFFLDYLRLCTPALHQYTLPQDITRCFTNLLTLPVKHLQMGISLSPNTLPPEVSQMIYGAHEDELLKNITSLFQKLSPEVFDLQQKYGTIDICPLATAEQVRAGVVRVGFLTENQETIAYYTPLTYCLHLKNILNLLNKYENYHFLPIPYKEEDSTVILVRENKHAILIRAGISSTVFEIQHPEFVQILQEYLTKIADRTNYLGNGRLYIKHQIRELISNLESNS